MNSYFSSFGENNIAKKHITAIKIPICPAISIKNYSIEVYALLGDMSN